MASSSLVALDKEVYLRPARQNHNDNTDSEQSVRGPSLILIFGWMQAKLDNLEKYSWEYARLYPYAIQLIVRCHPLFFFKSKVTQRALLAPVVQFLLHEGYIVSQETVDDCKPYPQHGVLTHVFSNGGASVLSVLSTLLSEYRSPQSSGPLPSALVLDSTPGKAQLSRTMAAFTAQMRSPFLRYPANLLVCLGYLLLLAYHKVFRAETLVDRFRRTLLSRQFLPWGSDQTPRLYVFSQNDELVAHEDVEEHIADAKRAGHKVETEIYTRSAHVAHMRTDPTRYWSAIGNLWDSTAKSRAQKWT